MKRNSTFKDIKEMCRETMDVPLSSGQFLYKNREVADEDTPESLNMKDGDIIEFIPPGWE